ncbi:MAG: Gfo/Idh/MocA family protein [Candidatus Flexifilum sp.]|jgi:predicted dehydrogenase
MADPISIGIIGAGIFARDAHLPALRALPDRFHVKAIYSRTRANAEARAAEIGGGVAVYDDLEALLARPDLEAVAIVLPIEQLPDAVARALHAGKHVLSEKPIAPDSATAQRLVDQYARHPKQVWMVGENWRYEAAFERAAEQVASGAIGRVLTVNWNVHIAMLPGQNKYYATEWRRSGTFMGGFLLDGGVHHVAALRLIAGEIAAVTAFVAANRPDLPPADTLAAALKFTSGALGSYTVTFALAYSGPHPDLTLVGEQGTLSVSRTGLTITTAAGTEHQTLSSRAVEREYIAFADAVQHGIPQRNTPQAALIDVRVIEALLTAARTGQTQTLV